MYEFKKSREEGFNKGLVVLVIGVGKIFLVVFDLMDFKKVFFVVYREEILN